MPAIPHVLVIGGGIAGLSLSLFLTKAGIAATVFEAYPQRTDIGSGLQLAPNGMAVLAELGLAGRVAGAGIACTGMEFRDQRGARFAAMPIGGAALPAVTVKRARLHEILAAAAAREGIPIEYGRRLVAIEEDAGGITARFADSGTARGDLLAGADGIHSRTRRLILPDAPAPAFTGLVGVGGFVPRAALPPPTPAAEATMTFCFGKPGAFFGQAYVDQADAEGLMWWSAVERARPLDGDGRAALTLDLVRRQLLSAGDGWFGPVRDVLAAATEMARPIDIYDMPSLPRWWRGRAVLVGDAAHAVTPHSGQGASLALEDAIALARRLRGLPAGAAAGAFAGFERERRARAERICALGRRAGDSTKRSRGPVAGRLQRLLMPLFLRLMAARQRRIHGYRVRWEG